MTNLLNELRGNEKLMKRVNKDKENGLREVTLTLIKNSMVKTNWYETEVLSIEKAPQSDSTLEMMQKKEEVFGDDFLIKVFKTL
jgi:hypothetical protein